MFMKNSHPWRVGPAKFLIVLLVTMLGLQGCSVLGSNRSQIEVYRISDGATLEIEARQPYTVIRFSGFRLDLQDEQSRAIFIEKMRDVNKVIGPVSKSKGKSIFKNSINGNDSAGVQTGDTIFIE